MPLEESVYDGDDGRRVSYTVPLTEAFEDGDLTPDEYVRRRAKIVGEGNIIQNLLIPLLTTLFNRAQDITNTNGAPQMKP